MNTKLGILAHDDKVQLQDKGHNSESYSFGVILLLTNNIKVELWWRLGDSFLVPREIHVRLVQDLNQGPLNLQLNVLRLDKICALCSCNELWRGSSKIRVEYIIGQYRVQSRLYNWLINDCRVHKSGLKTVLLLIMFISLPKQTSQPFPLYFVK